MMKICTGLFLLLALLVSACSEPGAPEPDRSLDKETIEANNRAVGLMGRFEYEKARALFAELVSQQPGWNDVKVNQAIATLNRQQAGDEITALELVREVLQTEPDNLRARYVAGLVNLYLGNPEAALEEFKYVVERDPKDSYAVYYLAQCQAQRSDYGQALSLYQRAIELNPYLRSAYYGAFQSLQRLGRQDEARKLAAEYQRLENNPRSTLAEFKYTRMGEKGEVKAMDLANEPLPARPGGALFTDSIALPVDIINSLRWRHQSAKSVPSLTTVDMQNNGLPDIFLTGVVEVNPDDGDAIMGNLVLDGQPGGGFTALTDHPLSAVSDVNAALWGDYDNDGLVDVYLCRHGRNQLWRQTATDVWQNVTVSTRTAGMDLDTVDGAFFDADHDGDLDLYLVNADGPNELFNNNLDGTFRPLAADYEVAGSHTNSTMVLPADLDNDRDVDLIVLNRTPPHEVFINDRMWAYRPAVGFDSFKNSHALAVLAADIDADGNSELYTVNLAGELLRWRAGHDGELQADRIAAPEILGNTTGAQLGTFDVNGDGILNLIVSSAGGWAVLSVGDHSAETLYTMTATAAEPYDASLPFIGTSLSGPSMLVLSKTTASLSLWQPGPGRYPFITVALSGRQDDGQSMRSNASGVGTQLTVRTGSQWSIHETYRNLSAPGQSLQPLAVGLRGAMKADFVSLEWSDGVFQSELDIEPGQLRQITETQRQLSSCPVLFAWDGEKYAFVSDVLGVGGMGYAIGPGQYSTPRPWENFLLPRGLLQAKSGRYELKVTEPMEENAYLDAARLAIYDLPPGWNMVMDERMGISAPEPTGEARFFRDELLPVRAINDRGMDVLDMVLVKDGMAAPVGELDHRFIGRLQGQHQISLEFPKPLNEHSGSPLLVIDGWVEYPYSQTNFAAWQAGAEYRAPSLEVLVDGEWQMLLEQFGYPAGMPRRMSVPLSELPQGASSLRLTTNMQVYWDRIAVVFEEDLPQRKKQVLPVAGATLSKTGFARRTTHSQFRPDYDYADLSPFWDTRYMAGFYTRLGRVEELVTEQDDAVAIIGPGEEVHLEFNEAGTAPSGWNRFFVLETNGWAKDMDLFTRDGETVGPLPSTGRPKAVRDQLHERYNTRYLSGY